MSTTDTTMENSQVQGSSQIRITRAQASHESHDRKRSASDAGPWSRAEQAGIVDVLFSNLAFLQSLSARAILNNTSVSKSWAAWYSSNTQIIAHARSQHDSSDWYFPLFGKLEWHKETTWSGIWHADASHSSGKQLSALPSLDYLQFICGLGLNHHHEILGTAGGLLLTISRRRYEIDELMDPGVTPPVTPPSLVVSNPLTRHAQALPLFQWQRPIWDAVPVDYHMLVDDQSNTYKVIVYSYAFLRSGPSILVYDSTSESWRLVLGKHLWIQPALGDNQLTMSYHGTSCMLGRLFFAGIRAINDTEAQNDPLLHGVLRLFEADIGDGHWINKADFPLRRSHDSRVEMIGLGAPHASTGMSTMHNWELVECMGRIFAVLPTLLNEVLHPWGPVRPDDDAGSAPAVSTWGYKYMPVQFYILQLEGAVAENGYLAHGVVRIEVPNARKGCQYLPRRRSLIQKMCICKHGRMMAKRHLMRKNWFSCTAKGSEIWITCEEDYLLQYNIISRKFKTHIIPPERRLQVMQWNFVYRPSFHLKP